MMKKLLLIAVLASTANAAPKFNLKDYKTVSVQPVLDTRGTVGGDLAALASTGTYRPDPKLASIPSLADSKGFGFAGKATGVDVVLIGWSAVAGTLAVSVKAAPERTKPLVDQVRAIGAKLAGRVDAKVLAKIEVICAAAEAGNFDATTAATIDAMQAAADAITKGTERPHAYIAVGLYIGLASAWANAQLQSTAYAELAAPLIRMLNEDAVMGGTDRKIAAQLEIVAQNIGSAKPSLEGMAPVIAAIRELKPD